MDNEERGPDVDEEEEIRCCANPDMALIICVIGPMFLLALCLILLMGLSGL
jgi:hypothetical protein